MVNDGTFDYPMYIVFSINYLLHWPLFTTKKGQKKEFVELLTSSDDPDDKFFVRAVETHDGWTTQIIGLEVYGINLYEMAEKIQSGLIIPA